MSVRNLQESYLFHDKKIYALVASALHVTCVLSVFFHSFLTQSHACSGQEGPGAELQQTRAPRSPDTARTQCSYGASLLASLGVRERPWFLQLSSGTPVHCPHSAGTSKCCQLRALVKWGYWGGTRSEVASRWRHKTVSVVRKEKGLLSALRAHN